MPIPSPAAGRSLPGRDPPRRPGVAWPRMVLHAAPVAVIAVYGAVWIALHAGGGRGSTHTFFQSLALAESVLALLLRGRKPVGALAGILGAYLLFQLDPLLLPAVLLALLTVAVMRDRRAAAIAAIVTATAIAGSPYLYGGAVSFTGYSLPRLAAAAAVVAAGMYLRTAISLTTCAGSGTRCKTVARPADVKRLVLVRQVRQIYASRARLLSVTRLRSARGS